MRNTLLFTLTLACGTPPTIGVSASGLETVATFGNNPGGLLMRRYIPSGVPSNAPLVVALHACGQGAADFVASGLDTLADADKFYLLYPEQPTSNNPDGCFNWYGAYGLPWDKSNITRGEGEDESIKEMVDQMKSDFSIDPARVFILGFSAGGAMAAAMLADWPDVFAAGAIVSGVPYDCPSLTVTDVYDCMTPGVTESASSWGQRVRDADPGWSGPWPRVSIWQGTQDQTVAFANSHELVKQWTNVHGLSATPTRSNLVAGFPHDVYAAASGAIEVESYAITGMDHFFPNDPTHGCGSVGAGFSDQHLCAASAMIGFFGISGPAPSHDAGITPSPDAGATPDAGFVPPDAGFAAPDAGFAAPDAGGGAPDAAIAVPDTGSPDDSDATLAEPTDAGASVSPDPDSGLASIASITPSRDRAARSSGCSAAGGGTASPLVLTALLLGWLKRRRSAC